MRLIHHRFGEDLLTCFNLGERPRPGVPRGSGRWEAARCCRHQTGAPPALRRAGFWGGKRYLGVLQAPSNLAWGVPREGASTASPGSLGQGFTTLLGDNFCPRSELNLPSFSLKPSPLVPSPLVPSLLVPSPLVTAPPGGDKDAGRRTPGGSQQSGAEGQNPPPHPVPTLLGMQPRARLACWAASAHCWVMLSFSS